MRAAIGEGDRLVVETSNFRPDRLFLGLGAVVFMSSNVSGAATMARSPTNVRLTIRRAGRSRGVQRFLLERATDPCWSLPATKVATLCEIF